LVDFKEKSNSELIIEFFEEISHENPGKEIIIVWKSIKREIFPL
jgi:predicted ribonuclease YlaK